MLYLVDVQYYMHGENKVLKEAALLHMHEAMNVRHFAIKPPFPMHQLSAKDIKTANYLFHSLGMLHWNEGSQEVADFVNAIPAGAIVLSNGLEKSLFLQGVLPMCRIMNLNVTFTSLLPAPSVHIHCPYHHHNQCALSRLCQLYSFLINK